MTSRLLPLVLISAVTLAAQQASPKPMATKPDIPRARDGHPDFSGIWTNATVTPLERPVDLGTKAFFTPSEALEFEKKMAAQNNRDRRDGGAEADLARAYNEAWFDRGTKVVPTLRTSLVFDPSSGRIPPLTPAAKALAEQRAERIRRPAEGPEDRFLRERCIVGENMGPPMLPTIYNNNFQFFQNVQYLVIHSEMIHDFRVIPINANRPHLPGNIRQWLGDARGHWEGDTLVVDTTNFTNENPIRGSDQNLHLTERFTLSARNMILYQFRVDDPTAFTAPWSAEVPMVSAKGPLYEYACHEGNRGMVGLLSGARADEKREKK